ncbi:MAG: FtsX-like permease family protein [Fimbriimonas sp.]
MPNVPLRSPMSYLRPFRIALALLTTFVATAGFAAPTEAEVRATYTDLLPKVSLDRIRGDFAAVSAFGSRLTGSEGEGKTFAHVERSLTALGAQGVRTYPFDVTVPDPGAVGALSVGGRTVRVHPLWPNLVRTSTCDVQGRLVYAGDGSLEAMRGLDLKGSIAVLEMGVGSTWKNAAKLGAKAVVFLQPDTMPRGNAETKFSAIPLDLPRFYLPLRDAAPVLSAARAGTDAQLKCRQDWVRRKSGMLVAEFPGTDASLKGQPIEVMAYADAMSVVPGLAPGAEAISGISAMLETARLYSKRPHARPLRVVLTGGHGMGLLGARERVRLALAGEFPAPLFTLSLDLSSGSRSLGSYARGWFYDYRNETLDEVRDLSRTFRKHAETIAAVERVELPRMVLVDAANDGDGRTWKNNVPGKFALDCEPMLAAGLNALTLFTVEDGRDRVDTPFDTLERVDLANVHRQTKTVVGLMERLLNDPVGRGGTSDYQVKLRPARPSTMSLVGGFATLTGRVVEYDAQKSFVPDTAVPNTLVVALPKQKTTMGVRNEMVQLTGQDARYRLDGLMPVSAYWQGSGPTFARIQAFHCDGPTGNIDYAASWGFYGDGSYPIVFPLKTAFRESPIVVFKCTQVTVYDLVDPQDLKALLMVYVMDAETGSPPQDWGEYDPVFDNRLNAEVEDAQTVFMKPGQRFKLLSGESLADIRMVLTNSSLGDESGAGFVAPGGKAEGRAAEALDGVFSDLPLNVARDFSAINASRLEKFRKYRIIGKSVADLHAQAEGAIKAAEAAQAKRDWPEAERQARAAWGYALRAHPVIKQTTSDVVNGVVFYLFLLVPFSYFIERLMVGNQLLTKQLAWSVGIFLSSFVLLRLIHPAFEIVSNPLMIFVAFVMGTLSLIVVSFILGKFEASLKAIRQAESGVHEVDIKRSSVAMAAFNLGVGNMRRRKARTVLTTLTLVVMTFIVLSFTSIVSELSLNELSSENPARYSGLLLRNPGLEPMQLATYRQVSNEFSGEGNVVRRTAYYGADIGETGVLTLQRADRVAEVRTMAGFDPGETEVLRPQEALLPGGRWFRPGERDAMILPGPLASKLKVEPKEVGTAKVTFAGKEYTVIGIADAGSLRNAIDLDGDGPMPADFSLSKKFQEASASTTQAFRKFERLDPETVFILPAETSLNLGADIRTMAVSFKDPGATRRALTELMPRLRMNLYASVPGGNGLEVKQFSVFQSSKGTGLILILVQLAIASVFVLNTMVASVYERTKEIGIFSSIGLAPNHIAMLFFAESLVYGVLGAVIGYFVAQGTAKIIVATNTLQGLTLNFSSTSAVMSAGIVMFIVLASTIYPARKAAQIAAPARNDEVFESEPEGDEWKLQLPFSISEAEAGPVVRFLNEWLKAYEEYTIGDFVTKNTGYGEFEVPERFRSAYFVEATAWLAPYDLGVSQHLRLVAMPSAVPGVYSLDLTLTRLSGDPENWPTVNQRFLANLRRQFLTWRTLDAAARAKYNPPPPDGLQPA